ncbi:hypothetical protein [Natrinema pellirubrum]|uniref:hypothetical protein n=1 Tax=Natrinema pellirubrum TaxID=69525 RepID=UPI00022DA91D|nr:hypothetical protein [Natrinema pellirubrum]
MDYIEILRFGLAFLGGGILTAILSSYIDLIRDRQDELKNEVYDPIYDELMLAKDGELPYDSGEFRSEWKDIDPHKKYSIGENTRSELNTYSNHIDQCNDLVASIRSEIYQRANDGSNLFVATQGGSMVILPSSPQRTSELYADNFVKTYASVLLRSRSAESLEKELIEYSIESNHANKKSFRMWPSEYYLEVWDCIEEAEKEWANNNDFSSRFELFDTIQKEAMEIHPEIESQMKKMRSWAYWIPILR